MGGGEQHAKDTASRKRTKEEEMSGLPRRVPDKKWREEKRDEGMMGREGKKRGIICSAEIFPAAAVMEHTHALL